MELQSTWMRSKITFSSEDSFFRSINENPRILTSNASFHDSFQKSSEKGWGSSPLSLFETLILFSLVFWNDASKNISSTEHAPDQLNGCMYCWQSAGIHYPADSSIAENPRLTTSSNDSNKTSFGRITLKLLTSSKIRYEPKISQHFTSASMAA